MTVQQNEQGNEKEASNKSQKQQEDQNGSLNDKEMALLLLRMEEQLCHLYQEAANETYSTALDSLIGSFMQNSSSNRRNLRDLITRHGWLTPEAAKREDYENVIQKVGDTPPPVV